MNNLTSVVTTAAAGAVQGDTGGLIKMVILRIGLVSVYLSISPFVGRLVCLTYRDQLHCLTSICYHVIRSYQ